MKEKISIGFGVAGALLMLASLVTFPFLSQGFKYPVWFFLAGLVHCLVSAFVAVSDLKNSK